MNVPICKRKKVETTDGEAANKPLKRDSIWALPGTAEVVVRGGAIRHKAPRKGRRGVMDNAAEERSWAELLGNETLIGAQHETRGGRDCGMMKKTLC